MDDFLVSTFQFDSFKKRVNVDTQQADRVLPDSDLTAFELIKLLSSGSPGSMTVLMEWYAKDPFALLEILVLDSKRLYDEHIWDVYSRVCGENLDRFIYHVQMELPNQVTGELSITGSYNRMVDTRAFFAKRTFGKPGSYWALEDPPTDRHYDYPIV